MNATPPGFRTEPNPDVSTANAPPTAPEFRSTDRQFGWLRVNRFTRPMMRSMGSKVWPKFDTSGVSITEVDANGRSMQIVRPDNQTGDGALLMIHGGGFILGTNREVLIPAAAIARSAGVPVFCPSYRLAPEDPFPAGLDDCHAGWTWLLEHAAEYGVNPSRIVIGGASAGGGHAASLVQRLHDEGEIQPVGQLLIYSMLDDRTAARRELDKPRHRMWNNKSNRFGWSSYLGHEPGETCAVYASAARREDLTGLPPAWIGIGGADLLLDENREYARRLRESGCEVSYVEIDGGIHGFDIDWAGTTTRAFHASAADFVAGLTS